MNTLVIKMELREPFRDNTVEVSVERELSEDADLKLSIGSALSTAGAKMIAAVEA